MAHKENTREAILEAAESLVVEKGVHALTIDTVAMMTGLGKGGVLYHFKYKVDLIKALVERHCQRWDTLLREGAALESGGAQHAWMRNFVNFSLGDKGDLDRSGVAIVALAASHPELLEPIREFHALRQKTVLDKMVDPEIAAIIALAVDGVSFLSAISIPPVDVTLREQVRVRLLAMLEEQFANPEQ